MGKPLSIEEVQRRIDNSFVQKVEVLQYKTRRDPVILHCLECNHTWESTGSIVLDERTRHNCPKCYENLRKPITLQCAFCGKTITRRPCDLNKSLSGLYYCSKDCGNKHKNLLRRESGEWENSKSYRAKTFETYEHKCAICGWDEDERVLEVHHIDENHNNNEINNLCLLCPTCHRKITLGYYTLTEDFKLNKKE